MPVSVSLLAISGALRVASLDLCADEYLLLLARPGAIASVSRVAQDPADSVLWRQARRYPANQRGLESVVGTHPNLLLTMSGGGRATSLIAERLHIRTITLGYPASIADVEANMVRVATALGDGRRADGWRRRLARLKATPLAQRDSIFLSGGGRASKHSPRGRRQCCFVRPTAAPSPRLASAGSTIRWRGVRARGPSTPTVARGLARGR